MADEKVKTSVVSYTIDADDIIVQVSPTWQNFAQENYAVGLTEREVVGHSLWEFIKDESTRSLYRVLLRAVRAKKHPISFPFRCDSPRVRRYMVMNITPHPDNSLSFTNELVETRSRNPEIFFQSKLGSNKLYYVMCSVCNKVRPYEDLEWMEVEEAFSSMAHVDEPVHVVYEVCESCSTFMQSSLQSYVQDSGSM